MKHGLTIHSLKCFKKCFKHDSTKNGMWSKYSFHSVLVFQIQKYESETMGYVFTHFNANVPFTTVPRGEHGRKLRKHSVEKEV